METIGDKMEVAGDKSEVAGDDRRQVGGPIGTSQRLLETGWRLSATISDRSKAVGDCRQHKAWVRSLTLLICEIEITQQQFKARTSISKVSDP